MTTDEFSAVLNEALNTIEETLATKRKEYAPNTDCLANFVQGASILCCTTVECCWYWMAKHIASISTMIKAPLEFKQEAWDEKLKDMLCYTVLLKACVQELKETA